MKSKSLREFQQNGKKAIQGEHPMLLTNRKGPIGILIPVSSENLSFVQAEAEKIMALQSLKKTWELAKNLDLDQLTLEDIDKEIGTVRLARTKKRKK